MDFDYFRRVIDSYILQKKTHLDFWHTVPRVNSEFNKNRIEQYYMPFIYKAKYDAFFDDRGVPLLNYRGNTGLQYNPIAISQYGLGNYNLFLRSGKDEYREKALIAADWLVENLVENEKGVPVWMHNFDWRYKQQLKAPWYSGLAQGQGISLLLRVYNLTEDEKYQNAAEKAFISLTEEISEGGVSFVDSESNKWIEEYIVEPPTHILNGFNWAILGVYDYYLFTKKEGIKTLFNEFVKTIKDNIHKYDAGFWSLYDLSGEGEKNLASPFYHNLHIVQLEILYKITGMHIFKEFSNRWELYRSNLTNRTRALIQKGLFKIRRF